DVDARMALANYCREHDMRAREQMLLEQVIAIEPNHSAARARLGFVKTDGGWITRAEHMRAQGMVLRDGQWVTRAQALEMDRLEAEAAAAAQERQRTEAALELQRLELRNRQLELETERAKAAQSAQPPAAPSYYYGGYGYGYSYGRSPYGRTQAVDHGRQ